MRAWLVCASAIALLGFVAGCDGGGGDDAGMMGTDSGRTDSGPGTDSGMRTDSGMMGTDGGPGVDAGPGTDSGMMGTDSGTPGGSCAAPMVTSVCAPQAVVRVRALLGAGMGSMSGALRANLHHMNFGGGATGGFLHTNASRAGVTVSDTTAAEVHFDMCAAGEMWSENNCGYNLWVYLDLNGNSVLDSGEPAGRAEIDVNCHDTAPGCHTIVLGCTAGMSCAAFTDPGGCTCRTPGCAGTTTCS